jgi:hypothetical protein
VYLKNARFGAGVSLEDRVLQRIRAIDTLRTRFPDARQSVPGAPGLAVPAESARE